MKTIVICLLVLNLTFASVQSVNAPKTPRIVGDWWQVAGNPELGDLTTEKQQPVDFSMWQAADGTWQLWSCIRHTKEPGRTRLFYRWQGSSLTQPNWKPIGIAMHADPKTGELQGGLQAPHVIRNGARFVMFYGGWNDICSAGSADGKSFERITNAESKVTLFGASTGNTRDPMVIRIGDRWHCYYTAHPENKGAVYCRTSSDLKTWDDARLVARGGQSGDGPFSSECPFVVELDPGQFYLFRTQKYGQNARCSVYYSRDPFDFGIAQDDAHFVSALPIAAPEIIRHNGEWFIAALMPLLKGIQIAKLTWE
jgi:glycosyl hydrolase family 32